MKDDDDDQHTKQQINEDVEPFFFFSKSVDQSQWWLLQNSIFFLFSESYFYFICVIFYLRDEDFVWWRCERILFSSFVFFKIYESLFSVHSKYFHTPAWISISSSFSGEIHAGMSFFFFFFFLIEGFVYTKYWVPIERLLTSNGFLF